MNDRPEDDPATRGPVDDRHRHPEATRPSDTPDVTPPNPEPWADDFAAEHDGGDSFREATPTPPGFPDADPPAARAEEPDPLERPLDDDLTPLPPVSEPETQSTPSWMSASELGSTRSATTPDAVTPEAAGTDDPTGYSVERVYDDDDPAQEPAASPGDRLFHVEDVRDHVDDSKPSPDAGFFDRADSAEDSARDAISSRTSSVSDQDDASADSSSAGFHHVEDRPGDAASPASNVSEPSPGTSGGDDDHVRPSDKSGFLGSIGSAMGSARGVFASRAASVADSDIDTPETATAPDESRVDGLLDRFKGEPGDLLDPSLQAATTVPQRMVMIAGAIAIVLALLSNDAGLALIVASALVPVSIALTLNQRDLFEKESPLAVSATGAAGLVFGVIISLVSSWIANSSWFSYGTLNYGAAGFGGRFANLAGSAPFGVWLLGGLLLPLLGLAAIVAVPIAMRRWPQFRNEVMDGVILCGTSAAGFAIGSAIVYWAPMVSGRGPQTGVADWTLTTLGVALLRPIVITLAGAMLGAGIWKYMASARPVALFLPALGSIGGVLLLSLGSLQFGPSGLWPEVIWTALVAIASFMIYRLVLNGAIAADRAVAGEHQARVVCPNCRRITPAGAFCAHCGSALEQAPAPAARAPEHAGDDVAFDAEARRAPVWESEAPEPSSGGSERSERTS